MYKYHEENNQKVNCPVLHQPNNSLRRGRDQRQLIVRANSG